MDDLESELARSVSAQVSKTVNTFIETRPLIALGVLVLLIGAYEMRKHVPKQPHSGSAVVHAVDDLEIHRHKHNGAQPTADRVRPGHRKTVTWDARL
jgi:hypothetical protein